MKYLFYLLAITVFFSCSTGTTQQQANTAGYVNVTNAEFKSLITKSNTVILDVRTPEETARGVIEGATKLDFKNKDFAAGLDKLDKDKTYLVYCHAGGRSAKTCKMMKEKGSDGRRGD